MAVQTVNKINDYLTDTLYRYPYLFAKLENVYLQFDLETLSHVLTLQYKNNTHEKIKVADIKKLLLILEKKNLELQPKRGGRASLLHI